MKSNILLLLFIILSVTALAEVDSILVAGPPLSGEIHTRNENYEPEVFFLGMGAGDTGIPMIPPYIANATERAYLTFPLDSLDLTNEIDSVKIRLWSHETGFYGNDIQGIWPIWNVPNGDTIKFFIDHVDFGDELDVGDWTAGDLEAPQTITSKFNIIYPETYNPNTGYFYIDVTETLQNDIENGRITSQYRIRFEIDSDFDNLYDCISFRYLSVELEREPHLFLYTNTDSTSIKKQEIKSKYTVLLENHPNPFLSATSINYSIPINSQNHLIEIFNVKGEKIKSFQCRNQTPIIWDGTDNYQNQVSSGVYFYRIKTGDYVLQANKMLFIKK